MFTCCRYRPPFTKLITLRASSCITVNHFPFYFIKYTPYRKILKIKYADLTKKLHNEKLRSLYRSTSLLRGAEFTRTSPGKRPFGRPTKSKDNIETDVREIGCENRRWMELTPSLVQ
jgi:hypothetical protein